MFFFTDNQLTTLPNNIFESLATLEFLFLFNNQLTTLPEHMFISEQKNLVMLNLHNNTLTTLPANVFKPLTKIMYLNLKDNQLTTLPENIFVNQTGFVLLKGNPWSCDNVFLKIIQSKLKTFNDYKEIVCDDGEPLREKLSH